MLKKVRVQKFKNISNIEIDLGKINVLIGGNNAGKSSFLQAIQFAVSVAQTTSFQNAYWRSDNLPSSISPQELIYTPIQDIYSLGHNGQLKEKTEDAILVEFESEETNSIVTIRKGRNKNISIGIQGQELGEELRDIHNPFSIVVPGLAGIPGKEMYVTPSIVKRSAARGDSNSVFRNILYQLSKLEDQWKSFKRILRDIFPELDIVVQFNEENDEYLNVTVKTSTNELPIDSCGTGVLQSIQILAYVFLFNPQILILDEPDSHLHPNNQRKLIDILKLIQEKAKTQILISTHSKYVVEELIECSNIFWINNGGLISKVDSEDEIYIMKSLLEIGALSEGEKLTSNGVKIIVLTEDSDLKYIKLILEANDWNIDDVELWPYQGCSNLPIANALIKYIKKNNPDCKILIHRDRDFLTLEEIESYKNKISDENVDIFIPEGNDLEYYFFSKNHFLSVYNDFTEEFYQELIDKSVEISEDKLIAKLINTRLDTLRKKGDKPNEGKIAVACQSDFNADPIALSHGKTLLKSINSQIQAKTGSNSKLIRISEHLKIDLLQEIKSTIWGV